jgi:hypothetical protein
VRYSLEMAEYLDELIDFMEGMINGGILEWLKLVSSFCYFLTFGLCLRMRWAYRLLRASSQSLSCFFAI